MKREYTPVSIDEVAKHCPFIRNTLDAGGANLVGEPQWHELLRWLATPPSPSETAHKLCNQSPYYDWGGTEQKLATAQQARASNPNLGPPKCDHIAIEREECKTCPHLALHTTPLSVGFKVQRPNGHAYQCSPATIPAGTHQLSCRTTTTRTRHVSKCSRPVADNGKPSDGDRDSV